MDISTGGGGDHRLESGGNHHHDSVISGATFTIMSPLLFAGIILILLLNQSVYNPTFQRYSSSCNDAKIHSQVKRDRDLEKVLKKAVMKDKKTVIITTLNAAWTEPNSMFDLFLESFRIGNGTQNLLNHVVVGAMDRTAYSRCLEKNLHCYAVTTVGVDFSGEAHFMSDDYLKMMWRRIDFLRTVLETGYDFVFTDADVMWLRDPFTRFYPDVDFQIACDRYYFNETDLRNYPNGGFTYIRSNNRTIQFYKFWYTGKEYFPGIHDQDVLIFIKTNPFIKRIGLEMRFLDTNYFSGFCESSKDLDLVITMHANCCVGMKNKTHDLKMVIDDWKRYTSASTPHQRNLTRHWTVPRYCGLHH